jgi:aminoglycoside phosphotransferase (APT) family kinase protein
MFHTDEPGAVRSGEQLDTSLLTAFLSDAMGAATSVATLRQFPGGYSNLTYLLDLSDGRQLVLRCPPPGAKHIKGGHDVLREYGVLCALRDAGFSKMPRPLAACMEEGLLGFPFYVMERVRGVVLRGAEAAAYGADAARMLALSGAVADNLAQLHAIDVSEGALSRLGKPEGYVRRQVDGWQRRYVAAQTDEIEAMYALYAYLDKNLPVENKPSLIHNDYKYDNFVLDPGDFSNVLAILDWEMSTVGDPLMDLGTALAYWTEAGDHVFERQFNASWLPGNLTRREFADRYAERSGRDIGGLNYYVVFGLFKNAVVLQQIYARWKKGLTTDARFEALIHGVHLLARKAARYVEHPI